MRGIRVAAVHFQVGSLSESNEDMLIENPSWDLKAIEQATGVRSRRLASPEECASDLAVKAAEKLFAQSTVQKSQIDALILCTQTPDYLLPTTACLVQERLKLPMTAAAFDINLGCSGYVYCLAVASSMLRGGLANKVLILNADTYSKFISRNDRTCRPIFGDGGAATVIETTDGRDAIGPFDLGTDGRGKERLIVYGSGTRDMALNLEGQPSPINGTTRPLLKMDGAGVLMFTMGTVPKTIEALLKKAGLTKEHIDLYVFHQASKTVLDNIVRHLDLPDHKVFRGFAEIGNTVSASIPIALKQAEQQGRLLPGQRVMLIGFGVGYSWGSCLLTWG